MCAIGMEMLRKAVLVGVMVVVDRGSVTQLVVGTIFCITYLLIQLQVNPYNDLGDDFFAASCSFGIIVLFVCCIMFKLATLTELPDLQRRMSYDRHSSKRWDAELDAWRCRLEVRGPSLSVPAGLSSDWTSRCRRGR